MAAEVDDVGGVSPTGGQVQELGHGEGRRLRGPHRPEFLRDERLHEVLFAAAARQPDRVALRCGSAAWTYAELGQRAHRVARRLRAAGAVPGSRVLVAAPKTAAVYAVMIGIAEAGGVYVPVDPDWPEDRIAFVAHDSGAAFGVVDGSGKPRLCGMVLFTPDQLVEAGDDLPLAESRVAPDDCAYILYTSGSTGRPKGVMISHRSICHLIRAEGEVLGLRSDDVVFQGASLSFDMSLEEIWPTWAAGATLLVGTREMMRAGADLASILAREGVTAWTSVPTLVAMQDERIPSLRLLNLGGEICPPALVKAWARPGLRILNTYGPTETTITATWTEVRADAMVTIGRPLPNYSAYLIPIAGEHGTDDEGSELGIGGPGVGLGYVNRPELTSERFVRWGGNDADEIVYRTGDRVRLTPTGELAFLGRIDTQVKLRGHRVELGEIEAAILAADPDVKQAAVAVHRVNGDDVLAAYVVPRSGRGCDVANLRRSVGERLPPYMIPTAFESVSALPMLPSGKIDRKALPAPARTMGRGRPLAPPITPTERRLHAAWAELFASPDISIDDDFFLELGGHSLRAAALVSALRKDAAFRHVSMVDVYNHPTIRSLAERLDSARPGPKPPAPAPAAPVPRARYAACVVGQGVGLVLVFGLFSLQWLVPYLSYAWLYNTEKFQRLPAIAMSLGVFVVAIPVMLMVGMAAKWLVLGRLKPGTYPLWGWTYYRWWLTQRLLATVPTNYLGRSALLAVYYRLLGARIGSGVLLDDVPIDAPDCVTIGEDTAFGAGASLSCCKVEGGLLKVGRIVIGRDCYIGASSVVALDTAMGDGAELGDLSLLPSGNVMGRGEKWAGSPGRCVGKAGDRSSLRVSRAKRIGFGLFHAVLLFVFPVFAILPIFPGMMLMIELDQNTEAYGFVLLSPVLAVVFVASMCLQIAALKWLLVGQVKPQEVPVFSFAYTRHWLVDQLMNLSLDVVNPLYATLYLNPWYRLLGVKLGARAEVSTASSIGYDLLSIGEESFIADAVSLGAPRIDRGVLSLGRTGVGRRAFVGNSAVIPAGTQLGDNVLVGVLSVPPEDPADAARPGSSWFGTPAVFLPQRQVATQFDEGSTFRPKRRLVAQRLVIEFIRVILPMTVLIACTSLLMSFVVDLNDDGWSLVEVGLVFPFLYLAYALVVAAVVAVVKWLVVGRYRPTEKPLWNHFVWRSELVTSTYENLAVPFFAEALRGTPFLAIYLRALGCRIGRRVYLDTTDVTEFDLVTIGDDAALNRDCGPQTHLFEDRVMKISRVDIGARSVIGDGSILLYDGRMEDDSTLGELSMLMKGETLPAATHWEGSPAEEKG